MTILVKQNHFIIALPYLIVITHYESLMLSGPITKEHQRGVLIITIKNSLEERASKTLQFEEIFPNRTLISKTIIASKYCS